jgi:hypothetical protein
MVVRLLVGLGVLLALPATAFAQSWSPVANTNWARNSATAVNSGGVLYVSGPTSSGNTLEAYDTGSNTWTQKAAPFGPLLADVNGTLYGAVQNSDLSASVEKFNASSNSWALVSDSPGGLGGSQMLSIGTQLYFITQHSNPIGTAFIGINTYDTVANTWTTAVQGGPTAYGYSATAVVNGKIYFAGGAPSPFGQGDPARLEVYDPSANTFTQLADMPNGVYKAGATAVNGKLYVVGGCSGASCVIQNGTQVYDPSSNTWTTLSATLQTARDSLGLAAIGNDIYAVDGSTGTVGTNAVEKLTIAATYYRIRNVWQNTYMHIQDQTGFVEVGNIYPTWWSAMWSIQDSGQGYVRLQNRWTGQYMHIQDLDGRVEVGSIYQTWDSAKWFLDAFNGNTRIRSEWQQNQFIHIQDLTGFAEYGHVYDTWASAQWVLEPVQ